MELRYRLVVGVVELSIAFPPDLERLVVRTVLAVVGDLSYASAAEEEDGIMSQDWRLPEQDVDRVVQALMGLGDDRIEYNLLED